VAGSSVVVLGGGIGGVVCARRLRRLLAAKDRVVLVERDPIHRFAPSFLWVMSGDRRPAQVTADLRPLRRRGIEVVDAEVVGIDTAERRVRTAEAQLPYDRLVVALGAAGAPESFPGFRERAHDVYSLEGARAAGEALRGFAGGRVAVLVCRLPYKCPAAPYETALLADALLRRRGTRQRSSVAVYTPEPQPMPVAGPAVGRAVAELLAARGIELHTQTAVERVDAGAGELVLESGDRAPFDLLLGVPPHRPPEPVAGSGLTDGLSFVPVDPATLATAAQGVYALGDVTAIPIAGGKLLPKAGVFAHRQAEVVARRIAAELAGREPTARFDGRGSCFLELGDGRSAFASGDFYAPQGPEVSMRPPARVWHLAKVAFERYWFLRWL